MLGKTYEKENNGMLTPQREDAKYFAIKFVGMDLDTGEAIADIIFWAVKENALNRRYRREERRLKWTVTGATDATDGVSKVLSFNNIVTEDNITLDFTGSIEVN